MNIKTIRCTSRCCPSQWEGKTATDEAVYIRYRSGRLSIDLSGKEVYSEQLGDDYDGLISLEEIKAIIKREGI